MINDYSTMRANERKRYKKNKVAQRETVEDGIVRMGKSLGLKAGRKTGGKSDHAKTSPVDVFCDSLQVGFCCVE